MDKQYESYYKTSTNIERSTEFDKWPRKVAEGNHSRPSPPKGQASGIDIDDDIDYSDLFNKMTVEPIIIG